MTHVRGLAAWVGQGRPVTPKGVLRPADVPDAAAVLGVAVPARIRTAADVEAIHRPWVAAQALGLVQVSANRAVATSGSESDPLRRWWTAVSAVLRAESHDDRHQGAAVLCRTLLTVLAQQPPPTRAGLEHAIGDLLHYVDYWQAVAVFESFRRGVMPVDAGMELLAEIGAVDRRQHVTPLGAWMRQRLADEEPPVVTPDLLAPDLLTRLATLPDDDMWERAGKWLSGRDVGQAGADLLAAASAATPAQRIVAVDVVAGIGEPALPAWRRALTDPLLAPHARQVLAELDEPAEPDVTDRRWLAAEFALAALAIDGPEEAYHLLRDLGSLDAITESRHPDAAMLCGALADLVAAGGPAVLTYQVKIALTRVQPQVWRRLLLPATTTLEVLHHVIQAAFDWDDDHLHAFTVDGRRYADPYFDLDDCADEARVRLSKVLAKAGGSMSYVYDMGDWWEHRITLEKIIHTDSATGPSCTDGRGDAPVEDWTPDSDRKPTPFDAAAINHKLAQLGSVDGEP
jgi:hypothetical protein